VRIDDLLRAATVTLGRAGLAAPEPAIVVAAALGRGRGDLELDRLLGRTVCDDDANRVREVVRRRARREPLQHILGVAPFDQVEVAVGPGAFVPRPETEVLVAAAADRLVDAEAGLVADVGSGTGAIAISLGLRLPRMRVVALEASAHAWPWLRRNVAANASAKVAARFGDWLPQLRAAATGEPLRGIVSNPPYVPLREVPRDPEVRMFDPEPALYSGGDGLDEIRRIIVFAAEALEPGGLVALEHTEEQGAEIRNLARAAGLDSPETIVDLAGRERHTLATRGG
jgi:release factor glutamine methyltransferase